MRGYWSDSEFKFYVLLLSIVILITVLGLYFTETYDDWQDALVNGLFQAVSICTTAGFTTAEFYNWPGFIAILLLFSSFVGGCAGSTGGGIKVIRLLLLVKQGLREITRLVHPSAKIPVRIGDKTVSSRVVEAVSEFEGRFARLIGTRYAVGVNSGTDALFLSLKALGIGPGDEVITTPFTFVATAETIAILGARPVYVDIDEKTFNIDPNLIEKAITPKTKAIIPVHLYGQPADMDPILETACRHGLWVVEDACQAHGSGLRLEVDFRQSNHEGVLIDAIVVDPDQHQTGATVYSPYLAGTLRAPGASIPRLETGPRKVIARRAADELRPGDTVNLGFGVSSGVASVLAEEGHYEDVDFSIEQGIVGGIPGVGLDSGTAINVDGGRSV